MSNPTRQLPNTDATSALALDKAALKLSISLPTDVVLSAETQARLALLRPQFNNNLALRGQALSNQGAMTPQKDAKSRTAGLYISHFINGIDNAALRGETGFVAADRGFFQLDITNRALPPLATDDDILLWGPRIITGEANRILAGKPVMPFPQIIDVTTKFGDFNTIYGSYNLLKRAYDDSQEAISNMRTAVASLILRMWNETEAAYSEEEGSSKRRNSREWGVVYRSKNDVTRTGDILQGQVANIDTTGATITEETEILFENPGLSTLRYYFGDETSIGSASGYVDINPNTAQSLLAPVIGYDPSRTVLKVQNIGGMPGSYKVTIFQ